MNDKRYYVFSAQKTVTFIVKDGVFKIDALAHNYVPSNIPDKTTREMVLEMMSCIKSEKVKFIKDDEYMPEASRLLRKFKNAVDKIEERVLNPYTKVGRQRLLKEFTLLIEDDPM